MLMLLLGRRRGAPVVYIWSAWYRAAGEPVNHLQRTVWARRMIMCADLRAIVRHVLVGHCEHVHRKLVSVTPSQRKM